MKLSALSVCETISSALGFLIIRWRLDGNQQQLKILHKLAMRNGKFCCFKLQLFASLRDSSPILCARKNRATLSELVYRCWFIHSPTRSRTLNKQKQEKCEASTEVGWAAEYRADEKAQIIISSTRVIIICIIIVSRSHKICNPTTTPLIDNLARLSNYKRRYVSTRQCEFR